MLCTYLHLKRRSNYVKAKILKDDLMKNVLELFKN